MGSIFDRLMDRLLNRSIRRMLSQNQEKLDDIREKIYGMDAKIYGMDAKINGMDAKINDIEVKTDAQQEMIGRLQNVQQLLEQMNGKIVPSLWDIYHEIRLLEINYINQQVARDSALSRQAMEKAVEDFHRMFSVMDVAGPGDYSYCRLGQDYDGGYVMLDDLPGGIAYSFGIADDVSWEKDMAGRGYDIYMYDHTIEGLPEEHPRFHWFKKGIEGEPTKDPLLETLPDLMKANGHEKEMGMILKIDVEGAEWDVLANSSSSVLEQFDQILFEMHGMNRGKNRNLIRKAMDQLNKTHQLVYIHANNNGFGRLLDSLFIPDYLESTFVSRKKYTFRGTTRTFPTSLDMPCNEIWPDIALGVWDGTSREGR